MLWLPLPLGEGWGEGNTLLLPKKIRVPPKKIRRIWQFHTLRGAILPSLREGKEGRERGVAEGLVLHGSPGKQSARCF